MHCAKQLVLWVSDVTNVDWDRLAVGVVIATLLTNYSTLTGSVWLHASLVSNVLRVPLQFYDTVPVGRLLNRFSKDIDALDNSIPHSLRHWIMCLTRVRSALLPRSRVVVGL